MTYALGIDTSHEVAVGLARDGVPIDRIVVADTRAHAETVLPSALALCERNGITLADIDAFAVGMGPGPFTGLRVGIVAAWTLASLGGIEPVGVCSLDVIAHQWLDAPREFVVASDARRKELYWARYVDGVRVEGPKVSSPRDLPQLPVAGPVLRLSAGIGHQLTDAVSRGAISAVGLPSGGRTSDGSSGGRTSDGSSGGRTSDGSSGGSGRVDLDSASSRLNAGIGQQLTDAVSRGAISAVGLPSGGRAPDGLDPAVLAAVAGELPRFNEPLYLRAADATVSTRVKSALPRVKR